MKEKIGLLYRVSSKPQETDGNSLDTQRDLGRKISKRLGFDYVEFDEGVQSSYRVEINMRPKLVELLDEIQKHNGIRKVWVINTDRLGRNTQSWFSILKVFIDYGVEVYVGDSNKPYDLKNSTDKLIIGVLSNISQYDNELRRMRSVMGKMQSLRNGNTYLGSIPPFGYTGKDKKLVENLVESRYVKEIFKMYDEGSSTMDIKTYLDKQIEIKPRKSKYGWNTGTIQNMLRNPLYIGKQVWRWEDKLPNGEKVIIEEIVIKTPKIVKKPLFDRVQKKMDSRIRTNCSRKDKYLLQGLLKCSVCKINLSQREQQNSMYYGRCKEYKWKYRGAKHNYENCGLKRGLRTTLTDKLVLDNVIGILSESKQLMDEYRNDNGNKQEHEKNLKKLRGNINKKEKEHEKIEEDWLQTEFDIRIGKVSEKHGQKLQHRFSQYMNKIDEDLESLYKQEKALSDIKGWENWLERMNNELDGISNCDVSKQRTFLMEHIDNINVRYDSNIQSHRLEIAFCKPIVGEHYTFEVTHDDENGYVFNQMDKGIDKFEVKVPASTMRNRVGAEYMNNLNSLIYELKITKGLSHSQVCRELNKRGIRTPTNKLWDKAKFSSYYNRRKQKWSLGKGSGVRVTNTNHHPVTVE